MIHLTIWTIAFAALLVMSEWWLFAGLGLFWAWAYRLESANSRASERFKSGLAWLLLGVVVQMLFKTYPAWHVGIGMTAFGWIQMAREPAY